MEVKIWDHLSGGHRTRWEIIADILNAASDWVKKTNLMTRSKMSFIQFETYLGWVLRARLLEFSNDGSHQLFKVTDKGRRFLDDYMSLKILAKF